MAPRVFRSLGEAHASSLPKYLRINYLTASGFVFSSPRNSSLRGTNSTRLPSEVTNVTPTFVTLACLQPDSPSESATCGQRVTRPVSQVASFFQCSTAVDQGVQPARFLHILKEF